MLRERDWGCVITGHEAPRSDLGIWRGLEAAHIFPLAYEENWTQHNFSRWINIPPVTATTASTNSVQNKILLRADIHLLFDRYDISINPDVWAPLCSNEDFVLLKYQC